ncbi:hypothetical protein [Gordonia terrae]|uniref:hypothetical protein n=1 Tax=Gordonia terrae TaxID=2055 RepID=UPI003F6C099C
MTGRDRSAPPRDHTATARVELARARVDAATRAARTARLAAAPALRERASQRTRRVRQGMVVSAVVAVLLVVVAGVLAWGIRGQRHAHDLQNEVLASARAAVTVMLSADPADADAYVTALAEVSTGAQRARIDGARADLIAEVSRQQDASVGQVVSAGLVTDPESDDVGSGADVLVVADATDPLLLGQAPTPEGESDVDTTAERITALVTMERTEAGWKIAGARRP